ncbi:TonB-dependent receptor [Solimonas terrae]|uniref:TonB-dependent receptor plug domain-containing protein n=1 Tax=Solimonas terrae TaxID=1396819 RepID=A0A6M2BSC3_9GAMM|nr:TonB-dependent receptor plug domain-containing protein [Solimonas terrae]NGY05003.1 TonB-dependent receptor plug domain-containing protein [Solimonas terrae]
MKRFSRRGAASLALCPALLLALPAAAQQTASPGDEATQVAPSAASGPEATTDVYSSIPLPAAPPAPVAAPQAAPASGIAEVIVTARRTAENLQDVPVAISTMNADDLQREQINTPQDLQGRVPSLVISSSSQMRNTESPTIRGQGAQYGASPGVVIYMAEVPLPSDPVANNQGGPGKFLDLSNLQILKGSQGTLFGRNTTGGAMLLEPHKPEPEFSASLQAGASSYAGQSYEGMVNIPLIGDTLMSRFAGQFVQRDGFTRDVVSGKDYDSKHYWTGRGALTWRPTDSVENYFMGYYTNSSDNGTATVIKQVNREGINQAIPATVGLGALSQIPGLDLTQVANLGCLVVNLFGPSTNCGQDILDEQAARGNRKVQLSADPTDNLNTGAVVDQFSYDLDEDLKLRNIASYSSFTHQYRWDLDGSRAAFNDFINPRDNDEANLDTVTEELQLQGKALNDALKYVVGGYYEHTDSKGQIDGTSLFFVNVVQKYDLTKRSIAPFAQGTYDLGALFDALSGLSLTAGVRYTWDDTDGTASIRQVAAGLVPLVDASHDAEAKASALTYTAGLDYKLGTTLLYGKVSRGYKSGGISVVVVNPDHYTYKPEYVTNYELGEKTDFEIAGIPARINSAVYYTDYKNLQKAGSDAYVPPHSLSPVPQLGEAIFNVGKAWVAGFEMDATIEPFTGFTFVGSYGYTRGEYQKFDLLYAGATQQLDCSGQQRQSGDVLELSCIPYDAPRHQYSLSARYLLPFDPAYGDIEPSVTYAWTDSHYSAQTTLPGDEPGAELPAAGLLNASISWRHIMNSQFDLQLYGTNLANKEYRISNSNQWHLTYFDSAIYSEPRIVGANLSYRWGN